MDINGLNPNISRTRYGMVWLRQVTSCVFSWGMVLSGDVRQGIVSGTEISWMEKRKKFKRKFDSD